MRSRVLRTGLTLLLSAMVFLGSVIPPAVQHAHAGGGQSHDHRATPTQPTHPHSHQHPHRHSHPHQSKQKNTEELPTRHCHLTLFGWTLHLPISGSPGLPIPGQDHSGDQTATWVRLFDTNVALVSAPAFDWLWVSLSSAVSFATIEADVVSPHIGWETLTSLPLCDSARGERSGVQLI